MALEIKDSYKLYLSDIDLKLKKYNDRLISISVEQEYLLGVIRENEVVYKAEGLDIDELTYGNRGKFIIPRLKKYKFNGETDSRFHSYITSYINTLKVEKVCIDAISQYSQLRVPFVFYKYVLIELNISYAKAILMGNLLNFGLGIGTIFIKEKKRNFSYESCCKAINWKASNDYRELLISKGKVPFDTNTAPDGVKWHIYHDEDFTYWWWWETRDWGIINGHYYKFIPTKFINGIARDIENFTSNFNTVEKIVDSLLLGNIDKLHKLINHSPNVIMKYRENSI